jgi:hypothetical protein
MAWLLTTRFYNQRMNPAFVLFLTLKHSAQIGRCNSNLGSTIFSFVLVFSSRLTRSPTAPYPAVLYNHLQYFVAGLTPERCGCSTHILLDMVNFRTQPVMACTKILLVFWQYLHPSPAKPWEGDKPRHLTSLSQTGQCLSYRSTGKWLYIMWKGGGGGVISGVDATR